jgi:hypothetical protein
MNYIFGPDSHWYVSELRSGKSLEEVLVEHLTRGLSPEDARMVERSIIKDKRKPTYLTEEEINRLEDNGFLDTEIV